MGRNETDTGDRRRPAAWLTESWEAAFRSPERAEVLTQFATRYLFFSFAVVYFSTLATVAPVFFDLEALLVALGVYFLVNSALFRLALKQVTPGRVRAAMAADLVIVTLCVIHDPNPIPPSALAFLMVLLGNGMRYGMRLFAEVLGAAVLGMTVAFALRYGVAGFEVTAGQVFFAVFWITLAVYAYILMGRIESQRRQLDYRSRYDMLTGLLNRHGLLAAADEMFGKRAHNERVTVLFADLNKFKSVNDRYGHGVGDMVLTEFARIFSERPLRPRRRRHGTHRVRADLRPGRRTRRLRTLGWRRIHRDPARARRRRPAADPRTHRRCRRRLADGQRRADGGEPRCGPCARRRPRPRDAAGCRRRPSLQAQAAAVRRDARLPPQEFCP